MTEMKLNSIENNPTAKSIMDFIVNNLSINLCSVKDIRISRQKDGQLKDIQIVFYPSGVTDNQRLVQEWQAKNPQGKKIDCYRDTGVSRPTINKYWTDMRGAE